MGVETIQILGNEVEIEFDESVTWNIETGPVQHLVINGETYAKFGIDEDNQCYMEVILDGAVLHNGWAIGAGLYPINNLSCLVICKFGALWILSDPPPDMGPLFAGLDSDYTSGGPQGYRSSRFGEM